MARELLTGVVIVAVCAGVCFGLGFLALKLGWFVAGRFVMMTPIWLPGAWNLWLVWRPGDQHEAALSYRVSAAIRGVAMVGPCAVFAVAPDAISGAWLIGIFLGGMLLSFAAWWVVDWFARP